MNKNIKNEILVKQSFSKVQNIVSSITNTTKQMCMGGGIKV